MIDDKKSWGGATSRKERKREERETDTEREKSSKPVILTRNWRRLSGKYLGREINGADRTVKGSFIRNMRINYYYYYYFNWDSSFPGIFHFLIIFDYFIKLIFIWEI